MTLLVAGPVALLIMGAIMDGKENDRPSERSSPDALADGPSALQSLTVTP